jgi:glycosyltransferase involved in cell wall biosynthesis
LRSTGDMKKILFVQIGKFSHINNSVLSEFRLQFPEYQIDVFNVYDYFNSFRPIRFILVFFLLYHYGKDFITRKKSARTHAAWQLITPFAFRLIKKKVRDIVVAGGYQFSFQTQSLFDASTGLVPHFLYTDSTVLTSLLFPDVAKHGFPFAKDWLKLEPGIYGNATCIFTFSAYQLQSMVDSYHISREKLRCVHAGSNIETATPAAKEYTGKNILFAGVEWERKGGPVLLKAFRKVRERFPGATLTIVGCKKKVLLRHHSAAELEGCTVTGLIPKERVAEYFRNATVFCLPTRVEPFGIVFIEAMMYKLPIVASRIGALPEFVHNDDIGFLADPDDVEGFANAIIRLFNEPELCRKQGEKACRKATSSYTWKNTVSLIKKEIALHV